MPGSRAECASSVTVSVVQDLQDEHEDLDVEEKGKQCRESVGQLTVRGSFVRWTALVSSRSSEHLQLSCLPAALDAPAFDLGLKERGSNSSSRSGNSRIGGRSSLIHLFRYSRHLHRTEERQLRSSFHPSIDIFVRFFLSSTDTLSSLRRLSP